VFLASLFPSWALADVGAARPAINEAAMTNYHNHVSGRLMVHDLERLD
jgi:hypothetical protein